MDAETLSRSGMDSCPWFPPPEALQHPANYASFDGSVHIFYV